MNAQGSFILNTVQSNMRLNEATRWITIENPIEAIPGQFVMVWLPGIGEKPFSIASVSPISLMVVDVGSFSHELGKIKPGDPIWIKGPLGQGFMMEGKSILLVGGGYGAAPLFALAKAAQNRVTHIDVCLGAATAEKILLSNDFADIGCDVYPATEDGSWGEKGLVTKIIYPLIGKNRYDMLYACGPTGMLSAIATLCSEKQINYQLSWEAHMRCGMGLCGSCEVPRAFDPSLPIGWLACFDGPVFKKIWH